MANLPKYDLQKVIAVAQQGQLQIGSKVILRTLGGLAGRDKTYANDFIYRVILSLTADDFSEVVQMTYRQGQVDADVYVVHYEGSGWYVKFYVDNDTIVTSCHVLEYPKSTAKGKRVQP